MRKKISFVVLSNSGAPAKQMCASKATLRLVSVFIIACLISVGYVVYDYFQLKQTMVHLQTRAVHLTNELGEIQSQRKQIQEFASEINSLKGHLLTLNNFEKKIRIIEVFFYLYILFGGNFRSQTSIRLEDYFSISSMACCHVRDEDRLFRFTMNILC